MEKWFRNPEKQKLSKGTHSCVALVSEKRKTKQNFYSISVIFVMLTRICYIHRWHLQRMAMWNEEKLVKLIQMSLSQSKRSTHCLFPNILHRRSLTRSRMEYTSFQPLLTHQFQPCNHSSASIPMARWGLQDLEVPMARWGLLDLEVPIARWGLLDPEVFRRGLWRLISFSGPLHHNIGRKCSSFHLITNHSPGLLVHPWYATFIT